MPNIATVVKRLLFCWHLVKILLISRDSLASYKQVSKRFAVNCKAHFLCKKKGGVFHEIPFRRKENKLKGV